jgi:flagellar biosynthetic protein FliR
MGLSVRFFFSGIQAGGEMVAMQVGFSMIQFADPGSGNQTGVIAHLLYMVCTLIFLALDGHLYLLRAFVETFDYIPAGGLLITGSLFRQVLSLAGLLFSLAIKVIAPVMAALFLVELALALMSRAAPQMHIMEIGFPLKIAVGFFFISMLFAMLSEDVRQYITGLEGTFIKLLQAASSIAPD